VTSTLEYLDEAVRRLGDYQPTLDRLDDGVTRLLVPADPAEATS